MFSPRIDHRLTGICRFCAAVTLTGLFLNVIPAAAAQTFTANFSAPADPPLVKDKFGVAQVPQVSQTTIQNASPFLAEAQIRDIRYEMGIGNPFSLAYDQIGGTATAPTYDFSSIDGLIQSWNAVSTFPLVAFSYDPPPLQTDGQFQDVPSNLSTWGDINKAYASHFRNSDSRPGVWFEQWNEPDLSNGGSKVFFNGNQTDYGNVYRNAANGVNGGDPDARVGGPAVAESTTYLTESGILKDPIDFVSIHAYSSAAYPSHLLSLRQALSNNYPQLPLLLTEYSSYLGSDLGPNQPNSKHQAAAAFFDDVTGLLTNTDTPKVYWTEWIEPAGGWPGNADERLPSEGPV